MEARKRIIIAAGGTGGHVYPAQGLSTQLSERGLETLFVAGGLATNRYFDRKNFAFREVPSQPLISKNPLKCLYGWGVMFGGVYQSMRIIRSFKPDAVVGFGSYYSIPTILAAKLLGVPIVLHEANCVPGKANAWLAPYVDVVGVHFPATAALLKSKNVIEVGMPLRNGYKRGVVSAAAARGYFQLDADMPTLLIFGGSQGARAINQLIKGAFAGPMDKIKGRFQVIHLTGESQADKEWADFYSANGWRACVKSFEPQMNQAWAAADAFIGRSGASTIAEAMEYEMPGILIPYPHAENHQENNADFLANTVGGAVKIVQSTLTPEALAEEMAALFSGDRLNELKSAIGAYKQRPSQTNLCDVVMRLMDT